MPKKDMTAKKVVVGFFVAIASLLFISITIGNPFDRIALFPLLNAAGMKAWVWPTHAQPPRKRIDDSGNKEIFLVIWTHTDMYSKNTQFKARSDHAFYQQVKGMNGYLSTHPDYFLVAERYIISVQIEESGSVVLSNSDCLESEKKISSRLDCAEISFYGRKYLGNEFMREMRSVCYELSAHEKENNFGKFLDTIDDLSVLDNLERIGPAENFSEEELSWFAENLPNCEVWE